MLLAGVVGAVAAATAVCTLTAAEAAPQAEDRVVQQSGATDVTPPSAVEDFGYPGADKILREKGLKLIKGDGHIVLTECSSSWSMKVEANRDLNTVEHCFKVTGKKGYLSLELPRFFGLWNEDHEVKATITTEGKTKTVDVPKDEVTSFGEGDASTGSKKATLLELRVTG
ncbi:MULTISPECIES: hypothetical protein [Streptomyces]